MANAVVPDATAARNKAKTGGDRGLPVRQCHPGHCPVHPLPIRECPRPWCAAIQGDLVLDFLLDILSFLIPSSPQRWPRYTSLVLLVALAVFLIVVVAVASR